MPTFVWEGKTGSGEKRSGEMRATDAGEVQDRLRRQNINPSRVKQKSKSKGSSLKPGGRVPLKNLVIFTRQFSTMVDAGLPLVQCLELLSNGEPNKKFKGIIKKIKSDIEAGSTLSDAMAKHPGAFDNLYVSLVAAGEVAGILDSILARLANQIEKAQALRRKVKSAFSYPLIVLIIAVVVVFVLLYKVIPTFEEMFADMGGGELPGPTQFVINLSEFVQANFFPLVGGGLLLAMGSFAFLNYQPTRAIFDRAILRVPLFGPLVRKTAVARFTRTLGTMVSSGVPIVDSLDIVAQTAGNMTVQNAILFVKDKISEGQNMVDPLMKTGVFPSMVVQMIGVGESTGALDTMLTKIADFYEDEVDVAVDNLTSMLEPLLMVFLGIVVGGMLIAMYLPIFTLAGNIQG